MTTTNWRDEFDREIDEGYLQGASSAKQLVGIKSFIEKTLSSAHQQWVSEVVGKVDGCHVIAHADGGPLEDDDSVWNEAIDAAISVIKDTSPMKR